MIDPQDLYLFEEHSSTLPVWWQRGDTPATVVYLDAHLDLQPVSGTQLAALEACRSVDEVSALEAPEPLNPAERYAFGIENFLYPAQRLGLINRLVWVSPPHVPRHYSPALIEYVQQMDGISFDELTGFRRLGRNALAGRLSGLEIVICDYDELELLDIEADYRLDIDVDYFVEVPADRLWIDPSRVVDTIVDQLGVPDLVTISRAVGSGFTPLGLRYVGDYIYSYFSGDADSLDYFRELTGIVLRQNGAGHGDALEACRSLVAARPDFAPALYRLALDTADAGEKTDLLARAARLDPAYGFDPARDANGWINRRQSPSPEAVQSMLNSLDTIEIDATTRMQAEVALARIFAMRGQPERAERLLEGLTGDYADHEEVLLAIVGARLGDASMREQNRASLQSLAAGVKNASLANFYLGELAYASREYSAALGYYRRAGERAAAWMLPLERMLACHRMLGAERDAAELSRVIDIRSHRLQQLAVSQEHRKSPMIPR